MNTVRALIDAQAGARPDAVYLAATDPLVTITYGQLAHDCRAVAARLAAMRLSPGETVSVVMPNGPMTVRLLLGAIAGGWAVHPVNLLSQPEQMRYVLAHADARVVFAAPDWVDRVRAAVADAGRPIDVVALAADADALPGPVATGPMPAAPDEHAMALLMYTSGTTGVPKGVMLSQRNLAANARAIAAEHALTPADRVTAVLPLFHINAFVVTMLAPMVDGGSLVMPPRFSANGFWPMAVGHGCTWLNLVPTMISYLLEGDAPPREALSRVRFCRSASAALPPEHHRAFESRFGIGIVETMGLTETAAPVFSNPIDANARRIGSVGRASGCEARVVDAQGSALPDGEVGEIVIRGPQVMSGYYKNEAATRAAFFPDGWLRTGDLGRRETDGFFFVTGRIKELIIKGGENIAPREIDEVLLRHPAVLDAAAVGIPDRHYGQQIMACVILRDGARCGADELRAFCEPLLGRYKTPAVWRFVTELPRGPSGKVQRLRLADLA